MPGLAGSAIAIVSGVRRSLPPMNNPVVTVLDAKVLAGVAIACFLSCVLRNVPKARYVTPASHEQPRSAPRRRQRRRTKNVTAAALWMNALSRDRILSETQPREG